MPDVRRYTPWLALVLGGFMLLGGAAHLAGITRHWLVAGVPADRRAAYLVFVGIIQFVAGCLDLIVRGSLKRGEASARSTSVVTLGLITAYAVVAGPFLLEAGGIFRIPPFLYPAAHLVLAVLVFRGR
ncbi:MAG TPA: hypothetical protein VK447_20950 [Myxococcaceae bacterium]|nr:hypothetical protein [Myxococcaceae bacterium]